MDERGRSRGPEESQRPVMRVCVCGGGEGICSLRQGQELHSSPFPLQNGYINFDKRRKVRRVLGQMLAPCSRSQEGERRAVRAPWIGPPVVCGLLPRSLLSCLSCGGCRTNVVAMTSDLTPISSGGYRGSGH